MAKAKAPRKPEPTPAKDRHSAFRARAREALVEVRTPITNRPYLVSTLLAPAESSAHLRHGTCNGYTEYMCRCDICCDAYSRLRLDRREDNLRHRKRVDGVLVSTLLGTPGYPAHGVVTGTYWYGCDCEPCRTAKTENRQGTAASGKKAADVRAENLTHLAPRESDGVLVSTLLGTEGYPDHGTYSGADWFGCWCEDCRDAKNTLGRLTYVLRRNWPATPERGQLSALARDILNVRSTDPQTEREQIGELLRAWPVWSEADPIEAMTDKLVQALVGKTDERAA